SQELRVRQFLEGLGSVAILAKNTFSTLFRSRFDAHEFLLQMESMGVRSLGIGCATAMFVGIVMAIQFAHSLEKFGAQDSVGRIVGLSEARELAPSLTALVVGTRIAAGIAAELGSMKVTEQIDAMRVLGADPIRRLVVPRTLAGILLMPLITFFALVIGVGSAMIVCSITFGISMAFFLSSAIDTITMRDFTSGVGKTPFFGFLIAIIGCHFGF